MAEGRAPRRRQQAAAEGDEPRARTREHSGWFVIVKIDPESLHGGERVRDVVTIGERLEVIKVVHVEEGKGSDHVAREHRREMEAHWAKARAEGADDLPDQFPRHLYRVIALGSYVPGHYAEETRQAAFGTF